MQNLITQIRSSSACRSLRPRSARAGHGVRHTTARQRNIFGSLRGSEPSAAAGGASGPCERLLPLSVAAPAGVSGSEAPELYMRCAASACEQAGARQQKGANACNHVAWSVASSQLRVSSCNAVMPLFRTPRPFAAQWR